MRDDMVTCSFRLWRNWARRLGLHGSCVGLGTAVGDERGLPLTCESAPIQTLDYKHVGLTNEFSSLSCDAAQKVLPAHPSSVSGAQIGLAS